MANLNMKIDDTIKKDADALFANLGLDTPTAVRIFLKQAIQQHGLPFEVTLSVPNSETIAAMQESDRISHDPNIKGYTDVDEMMKELLA